MMTYFQDFIRDNGRPVTVEYSASPGEDDYDHPGHICDGGGSGPEIHIIKAWPDDRFHNWLAGMEVKFYDWRLLKRFFNWLISIDERWRANLTEAELQRFEEWLIENYIEEPYEPDWETM